MFVDSHTHLTRLEDSREGAKLAAALPNVYSSAGIHPHNAGTYTAPDLEALAELSESPGIVALGEVGLDYYRGDWSKEIQRALFEDVISLVNDMRLPLIIHSREAFDETMAVLSRARVPIVLHCFEGGEREAREATERGYYVGLAGNTTYKNSRTAEVLEILDPERILVETDAPYLSPQAVRSKRNEPKYVVHTARFVAERIGMGEEEFGTLTSHNTRNVFGLPLEV